MRRYHPNPFNEVPISHKVDIRLNAASMINQLGLEPWEIVEEAIDDWLAKNEPGAIPMPQIAGVQWKKLFLPNGTVLRTIFNGKNYHCRVDDDELLYEGKATSPSRFANMVGGLRRNAWKVIWVLLPETRTWQLADDLRPARPIRTARRGQHASRVVQAERGRVEGATACRKRTLAACCGCSEQATGRPSRDQNSPNSDVPLPGQDRQRVDGQRVPSRHAARQAVVDRNEQGSARCIERRQQDSCRRRSLQAAPVEGALEDSRTMRRFTDHFPLAGDRRAPPIQ